MNDTPGKMLSSLTGGDKHQHPKIGGCVGVFFQMFDWNKRFAGKKLFSNRLLPAGTFSFTLKFSLKKDD